MTRDEKITLLIARTGLSRWICDPCDTDTVWHRVAEADSSGFTSRIRRAGLEPRIGRCPVTGGDVLISVRVASDPV